MEKVDCFHCGQATTRDSPWSAEILGAKRAMCCAGCAAVAQAIVQGGATQYYENRTGFGLSPDALPDTLRLAPILDDEEWQRRHAAARNEGTFRETIMRVEGLRCGACSWLIEQTLTIQPGVVKVSVNASTERIAIEFDPKVTALSTLAKALSRIGYGLAPLAERDPKLTEGIRRRAHRRLFVAGIGAAQVMMYAFPEYFNSEDLGAEITLLLRWVSLVITVPVVMFSAVPFYQGAWRSLRAGMVGMDVSVSLGILLAFAASIWATITGAGSVWYDSVSMFVFLLLSARQLDASLRAKALRIRESLASALPDVAERQADDGISFEVTPPERLQVNDIVRVKTGERFPSDIVLIQEGTEVDLSLLTGESKPVVLSVGDRVAGGAINVGRTVLARVVSAGTDTTLSTLTRLVDRAAADRPESAALADKIAAWFTGVLILLALTTGLAWYWAGSDRALEIAISVLVVSCPCALSLATPAALAAAAAAALKAGAVLARHQAIDTLSKVTDFVFDKTGTLTEGTPKLTYHWASTPELHAVTRSLAETSTHPISRELFRHLPSHLPVLTFDRVDPHSGLGIEGIASSGRRWRLGSPSFVRDWVKPAELELQLAKGASVFLCSETGELAAYQLEDTLRPETATLLDQIRQRGFSLHVLSGDLPSRVHALTGPLGIDPSHARGGLLPVDKLAYVRDLQTQDKVVAMVGDGINDAPVLAGADVSFAVAEGAALASTSADGVLLHRPAMALIHLLNIAQQTRLILRQNLAWALGYNVLAVPAAMLGYITPLLAGLGMAISSLIVVANAARLLHSKIETPLRRE